MTGREHIKFDPVDMIEGWRTPPGFPSGLEAKILSGNFDEANKRGSRTRLMRFQPGACSTESLVHEFWEEVYVVSGDLYGIGEEGRAAERFPQHAYTCRPPGIPHGPFKSETGCILLEIHYFDPEEVS